MPLTFVDLVLLGLCDEVREVDCVTRVDQWPRLVESVVVPVQILFSPFTRQLLVCIWFKSFHFDVGCK